MQFPRPQRSGVLLALLLLVGAFAVTACSPERKTVKDPVLHIGRR